MPISRPTLLAAVGGLAVGALAVGIAWIVAPDDEPSVVAPAVTVPASTIAASTTTAPAANTAPITLPAKIGSFVQYPDLPKLKDAVKAQRAADLVHTVADLSAAYGGAPAAAQTYGDEGLTNLPLVVAVRASSPLPWVPYTDPAYLKLARPVQEVLTFGEVRCTIRNNPTQAGKTPAPDSANVGVCMRTSADLTVEVMPSGDMLQQPDAAAKLVDEVWAALGGQ